MTAYYNEIDPDAVATLREAIACGIIAPGHIDSRSIKDVTANDLQGFSQVHLFAGAGLWSVAARMAGWPDERPLWSASCLCQGESLIGKQLGKDDPRHLWPDVFRIVRAARPPVIVGEQVAAAAGSHWLDGVCADLAIEAYAARAVVIPSCAVDAPIQRDRIYWIAMGGAECERLERLDRDVDRGRAAGRRPDSNSGTRKETAQDRSIAQTDGGNRRSWWGDAEWIECHDRNKRRAKPGVRMLVNGLAGRIGLWRLAGNSISPVLAAEVIGALMDDLDNGGANGLQG